MKITSSLLCLLALFVFGCAHRHQEAKVPPPAPPGTTWTLGAVKMNGTNLPDGAEVRVRPLTGAQSQ